MINGAGGRELDRHDSPAKPKAVVSQAVLVDSTQAVTDTPGPIRRPEAVGALVDLETLARLVGTLSYSRNGRTCPIISSGCSSNR